MTWWISDGTILFCTTPLPRTLNVLHQYVVHVLFVLPAPVPDGAPDGTVAPNRNKFLFTYKPNTFDLDHIIVPAGWNSWAKDRAVLRDGFEANL